jgi:hypothetical protein
VLLPILELKELFQKRVKHPAPLAEPHADSFSITPSIDKGDRDPVLETGHKGLCLNFNTAFKKETANTINRIHTGSTPGCQNLEGWTAIKRYMCVWSTFNVK